MKYYIAYGSNLNMNQMEARCPGSIPVGRAMLEGWQLAFRGSQTGAYLTIDQRVGGKVPVGVWRICDADEEALDRYEGFPRLYVKRWFDLDVERLDTGEIERLHAFAYTMTGNRPIGVPSQNYIDICATGYTDFGLDLIYLADSYIEARRERHGK